MKTTTSVKILSLLLVLLLCPTVLSSFAVNTDADGGEISVSITWTDMSFTYVDGAWDPVTHTYAAGSWQPTADGGKITVANTGSSSLKFSFSYSYSDINYSSIGGKFTCNGGAGDSVIVSPNSSSVVNFTPTGKPSAALNNAKLGTITVSFSQTAGNSSININGKALSSSFKIIYSDEDNIYGSKVFAYRLQKLLKDKYGYSLNVYEDNQVNPSTYEIVIGVTNRGTQNSSSTAYSLVTNGYKLYINSPKSVGYEYIYNALEAEFSAASVNGLKLNYTNGDTYIKELSEVLVDGSENALGKTGDIRIMFNNVLVHNQTTQTVNNVLQTVYTPADLRAKQLAAVYADYMPDVLGLQEFGTNTTNGTTSIRKELGNLLTNKLGYREVSGYSNNNKNGETALFYNPKTVECVASGFRDFPAASNGIQQDSRGIAWGVFKEITTGNQFIVGSTHFFWAELTGTTTMEKLVAARVENAKEAIKLINDELSKTYPGLPIFLGGDFNSQYNTTDNSAPLKELEKNSLFTNVVHLATKAEAQNTHHIYPSFNDGDCLADSYYTGQFTSTYTSALDHIFAYKHQNYSIQFNTQAVINDFLAITSSDHDPVLLDFSFSNDHSSGKK